MLVLSASEPLALSALPLDIPDSAHCEDPKVTSTEPVRRVGRRSYWMLNTNIPQQSHRKGKVADTMMRTKHANESLTNSVYLAGASYTNIQQQWASVDLHQQGSHHSRVSPTGVSKKCFGRVRLIQGGAKGQAWQSGLHETCSTQRTQGYTGVPAGRSLER
eukprot:scaffold18172_cov16-Tisochrysis_lutea.AAC.1